MKLSISPGNRKTGRIPSVSLPPGITCTPAARRTCFVGGCYAAKLARIYPTAAAAWRENLALWNSDPAEFERQLREYLTKRKPRFFRWHVSGDIPCMAYLRMMRAVASAYPRVKFLAFTKTGFGGTPDNLTLIRSAWPGAPLRGIIPIPVAYMRDAKNPDPRIPEDARECPGNCETCGMCWSLRPGESVVFDKH